MIKQCSKCTKMADSYQRCLIRRRGRISFDVVKYFCNNCFESCECTNKKEEHNSDISQFRLTLLTADAIIKHYKEVNK